MYRMHVDNVYLVLCPHVMGAATEAGSTLRWQQVMHMLPFAT